MSHTKKRRVWASSSNQHNQHQQQNQLKGSKMDAVLQLSALWHALTLGSRQSTPNISTDLEKKSNIHLPPCKPAPCLRSGGVRGFSRSRMPANKETNSKPLWNICNLLERNLSQRHTKTNKDYSWHTQAASSSQWLPNPLALWQNKQSMRKHMKNSRNSCWSCTSCLCSWISVPSFWAPLHLYTAQLPGW